MHATPGKCWSVAELTEMLHGCGFVAVSCRATTGDRSAVLAPKPG
jgi:3-hydroxy-5-methyl-1-naphthoate 3-O-methyltransferase